MPFAAGGRDGAVLFAGAKEPIAARTAVSGDKVVLVRIPGATTVFCGDHRSKSLVEQSAFGRCDECQA